MFIFTMQTFARTQKENQNADSQYPIVCYPLCAQTLTSATQTVTLAMGFLAKQCATRPLVARLQAACSGSTSGL